MLKVLCATAVVSAAAVFPTYAAGVTARGIHGNYIEARTADVYTGPCFANGEVDQVGKLAVLGWTVTGGEWQGVDLNGLSVVSAIRARNTLGDVYTPAFPVKAVLIVDSRANAEQRLALQSFAKYMAGDLLQDVVRVDYAPIELKFEGDNVHSASAMLTAGSLAKIQTRAMNEGDHICNNEEVWYPPLTKLDHAMPAYALAHSYSGRGLDSTWSNPYKRSGFVGTFSVTAR
jgi:hypothetical protein